MGPIREPGHRQRKENLKIIKHLAMISFFSKSSLAYDSTLDDYKLMDFIPTPQKLILGGAWISEDGGKGLQR